MARESLDKAAHGRRQGFQPVRCLIALLVCAALLASATTALAHTPSGLDAGVTSVHEALAADCCAGGGSQYHTAEPDADCPMTAGCHGAQGAAPPNFTGFGLGDGTRIAPARHRPALHSRTSLPEGKPPRA